MFNVRLLKSGVPAISKPCDACQKMLDSFGVKRLYYTNRNGEQYGDDFAKNPSGTGKPAAEAGAGEEAGC